ncbi:hypothetical protein [Evansella halocellulosilytica]|uniref:hypothetical protein n=1 Tax=Evansella halocellulosilytica TaxID=2011013 RepID=UPI000BB79CD6|nr:hypothetical protein [Evansella halocellulosilytica]
MRNESYYLSKVLDEVVGTALSSMFTDMVDEKFSGNREEYIKYLNKTGKKFNKLFSPKEKETLFTVIVPWTLSGGEVLPILPKEILIFCIDFEVKANKKKIIKDRINTKLLKSKISKLSELEALLLLILNDKLIREARMMVEEECSYGY